MLSNLFAFPATCVKAQANARKARSEPVHADQTNPSSKSNHEFLASQGFVKRFHRSQGSSSHMTQCGDS